jgi:hypothetical protein
MWRRRWRWQQSASDWATESGTYAYTNSGSDPDSCANSDPYSGSYTSADSDSESDSDPNPNSGSHTNAGTYTDADADSNTYSDPDRHELRHRWGDV